MCGILGFSKLTDVTRRMIPFLAWEMEDRGKDSWGATDGVTTIKNLGAITESWFERAPEVADWKRMILHTRSASVGKVCVENQHPFVAMKENIAVVGIHNGHIANYEELNKKHKRSFECDSPHVFEAIIGNSATGEVRGWGNCAWFRLEPDQEPSLRFVRFNSDNLYIAQLITGEIVFCSLRAPIIRAALMSGSEVEKFYEVKNDFQYEVKPYDKEPTRDALYDVGPMVFSTRYQEVEPWKGPVRPFDYYGAGAHRDIRFSNMGPGPAKFNIALFGKKDREDNICMMPRCVNKVAQSRKRNAVCEGCLRQILKQMTDPNAPVLPSMCMEID